MPEVAVQGRRGSRFGLWWFEDINPLAFHPFHGPPPALPVNADRIRLPDVPGIGFELRDDAWQAFRSLTTPPD
jgi:L-alanine-DL-glutamate epimerase-like enolase superfamily enzyme